MCQRVRLLLLIAVTLITSDAREQCVTTADLKNYYYSQSNEHSYQNIINYCKNKCDDDENCVSYTTDFKTNFCSLCGYDINNKIMLDCSIHETDQPRDKQTCYLRCHVKSTYYNYTIVNTTLIDDKQLIECIPDNYIKGTNGETKAIATCKIGTQEPIFYKKYDPVRCVEDIYCEKNETKKHKKVPRTRIGSYTNWTCQDGYLFNSTKSQTVKVLCRYGKFYQTDGEKPRCIKDPTIEEIEEIDSPENLDSQPPENISWISKNWWIWIVIGVLGLILLIIIFFCICNMAKSTKKKKKEKEEPIEKECLDETFTPAPSVYNEETETYESVKYGTGITHKGIPSVNEITIMDEVKN